MTFVMKKQEPKVVTDEMVQYIKRRLLEKLLPMTILVSEKSIIAHRLELDTTDITDNNNVKLARSIAEKVFGLLPQIVTEVGVEITNILGEK